jgi:hypothetical protein
MKPLSGLPLDQIGHAPGRPQPRAVTQHLGTFFQSSAQFLQLPRQQPGFATGSGGLKERLGSLFPPRLVPPADRLAVDAQFAGHLALTEATIKESSGLESPPFQFIEIAFNAFWVAHAQRVARKLGLVTILCETQ